MSLSLQVGGGRGQSWARAVAVAGVIGAIALSTSACTTDEGTAAPAIAGDASYGEVPSRTVVGDLPDGFFNPQERVDARSSGTIGAPPIAPRDATYDAPNDGNQPDGGVLPPGSDGPGAADAAGDCDLLLQNCARAYGCYPRKTGTGQCLPPGVLNQGGFCVENDQCAPGLLCVDNENGGVQLCAPICDPQAATPCPGGRICNTFPGSSIGTCAL